MFTKKRSYAEMVMKLNIGTNISSTPIHTYIRARTRPHTHTRTNARTHAHTRVRTYTNIHTHTHIFFFIYHKEKQVRMS